MKKPLVILVYTRTGWDIKNVSSLLPLSVLYLVRPLRRAGFDVALLDQRIDPAWERRLRELAPGATLVGISAMTERQIEWGLRAATIVRRAAPNTPIVWGGIHASLMPAQTARHPLVDIVVRREGEITLPRLAQTIVAGGDLREVAGLTLFRNGEIIATPDRDEYADLDDVLIPDYDAIKIEDYVTTQTLGVRDLAITTSRGCPGACRYCYNLPFNRRRWRAASADAVVAHIKLIVGRFAIDGILIKDDNFYVDRKRVEAIAEGLRRENLRVTIRGECRADYIARHWDEDFLRYLHAAGFREMTVGAESGDDETLEVLQKGITVADIKEANERLRRANIPTKFTFMTGFPGETPDNLRRTLELMLHLTQANETARVTTLHLFTPYPGTPVYEAALAAGYRPPVDLAGWSDASFHELHLPWIDPRRSRQLERASLATYFLDGRTVPEYFSGHALIPLLARLYTRVIRWRCRRMFFRLMPEAAIIDWYRGRQ